MPDEPLQIVEDSAMSPQCFSGQHAACKRELSYMAEDGVARKMICPCRCHGRAAGPSDEIYTLRWEYEVTQAPANEGEPELTDWLKRGVIATSRAGFEDWVDAVAALAETSKVRNVRSRKGRVEWEEEKSA